MTLVNHILIQPFVQPYMQRAVAELVLLSIAGAVCGLYVLLRRLAFLAETLQHSVFPGIAVAYTLQVSLLLGALCAAALTIVLLYFVNRRSALDQDAVLALLMSMFFATGVVIVSRGNSYQHDLTTLLFGRVLAVDAAQLWQTALVVLVVLTLLTALHKELIARAFDPEGSASQGYSLALLDAALHVSLALVVVAAVQAVGTVLLVAFVITPVAAARLLHFSIFKTMVVGAFVAITCSWVGLGLSYELSVRRSVNVASGASVVLLISAVFILVSAFVALRSRFGRRDRIHSRRENFSSDHLPGAHLSSEASL